MLLAAVLFCIVIAFTILVEVLIAPSGHDVECPPLIEASTKLRLYFNESPPEPTDADMEFAEACGLEWTKPILPPSPEDGGA